MAKIEVEQLVAGAILKFGSVLPTDIDILIEDFNNKKLNYEFVDDKLDINKLQRILNYIIISDSNKIYLRYGYTLDSYVSNNHSLKELLEEIAGPSIVEYFRNLSLEEFILRRLSYFEGISEDNIICTFDTLRLEALKKLKGDGCLSTTWTKNAIYDDCKSIVLSKKGRLRLFEIDYAVEIEQFKKILEAMKYDVSLLRDFLMSQQNLGDSTLSIGNFEQFCNDYDRQRDKSI